MKPFAAAVLGVLGAAMSAAAARPQASAPHVITRSERRVADRHVSALAEMARAVNAGDAQSYARLYAPDAVITIHGTAELKGRRAIEQHEVELLKEFPGARLAFYAIWQKGPLAVVHYAVNAGTPGGQSMGHEGLLFYRFHPAGLIEEEHRYQDSLTPMAQLGMLGAAPARPAPILPTEMKRYMATGSLGESENVALVTASFAALDSKAEPAFLAGVAENSVVDELILPQPFAGKPNVKTWFETWTGAVPDASTKITAILGIGDFVLVETILRGTLKGPLGRLSASDRGFAVHRGAVVQVTDGRLSRIWCFMNGKELAQAVGQWPPPGK